MFNKLKNKGKNYFRKSRSPANQSIPTGQSTPPSAQEAKSEARKIAKDALKCSLVLITAALPGVPFKGAFAAAIEIIKIAEKTAANGDALKDLAMHCNLIKESIEGALRGKDKSQVPDELRDNILRLQNGLEKVHEDLSKYARDSLSSRLVAVISCESDSGAIDGINKDIMRLLELFWLENHIAGTIMLRSVLSVVEKQDILTHDLLRQGATLREDLVGEVNKHALDQRIQSLPHADAAYNSYVGGNSKRQACFQGTRETILSKIARWIGGLDGQRSPIYVLHGIAGIGKSTVAQTIAQRAAELGYLGASFFFSRNEEYRRNGKLFFSTIALQLSQYDPAFANKIGAALERMPDAATRRIPDQLKELIVNPLRDLCHSSSRSVLIVIDALDECDVQDAREILSLLAWEVPRLVSFKVFITTRPEQHIRHILDNQSHERFSLHEIEHSVVQADIRLYLHHQLSREMVQKALPELEPPHWEPSPEDLEVLVQVAGKLFIIASTTVRFILDAIELDPYLQMARLLRSSDENQRPEHALDDIYLQILCSAVPDNAGEHIVRRFQKVVGTIVLLQDPLPAKSLANLLAIDINDVSRALSHLHSIIVPSSQDGSPQIYHKSFPDFITDAKHCRMDKRFLITPKVHHAWIAVDCFRTMDCYLHENICDLGFPECYLDNSKVRHLTDGRVSPELSYACCCYAEHLSHAGTGDIELLQRVENFVLNHILNWLEVLSLIGCLDVAYPALGHTKWFVSAISTKASKKLWMILNDSGRLVSRCYDIIHHSALHTYHSALTLTPHDTELFCTYSKKTKSVLSVVSGIRSSWDPLISVLSGHSDQVNTVEFSPDGSRIASASDDHTVWLWDGATGASIATLKGHSSGVNAATFSPDGSKIASASHDNTVQLWDGTTGASIATLEGHSSHVNAVVFSPDGSKIASASGDHTVQLWDSATGGFIATLKGHSDWVMVVTFSPDGLKIASASDDYTIQLWDSVTGASIATLKGHSSDVNAVAFSPDGSRIASASNDYTVQLWDGATGASISTLKGHSSCIMAVTFSPDGSKIASASDDHTVRLWDGTTGSSITTLKGHSSDVNGVAFSPDGSKIASASNDYTVQLWDAATGTSISSLKGHSSWVSAVTFSPDGSKIASASWDNTVQLWDGAIEASIATLEGHLSDVYDVTFSPDGSKIASASDDCTIQLWDCATGASIATLKGHSSGVNAVVFSPDGSKIASASRDNTVQLWDGATGTLIATLEGHSDSVMAVTFSPDGSKIASASDDHTVQLWDGATGASIATLEGHSSCVRTVAFSPDGLKIASASDECTVWLWDVATLEGHSSHVNTFTFSLDGSKIALATYNNHVQVWDGTTGKPISLQSNASNVFPFSHSLGQPLYLSLQYDSSMSLWHITGSRQGNMDPAALVPLCWLPHDIPVSARRLPFAYTASHAALGCRDGRVILFDIRNVHLD